MNCPLRSLIDHLCGHVSGPQTRIIPVVGPVREQFAPPKKTPHLESKHRKGRLILMAILSSTQELDLSPQFKDKRGNPAEIDGVPEWLTDNSELLSLAPTEDGRTCTVRAVGALGTARVTMTADALVGEGTESLVGTVEFQITAGKATVVELVPGPAREQEEEEPVEEEPPV